MAIIVHTASARAGLDIETACLHVTKDVSHTTLLMVESWLRRLRRVEWRLFSTQKYICQFHKSGAVFSSNFLV